MKNTLRAPDVSLRQVLPTRFHFLPAPGVNRFSTSRKFRGFSAESTKNHFHDAEPERWRRALDDSLRYLRTDRIDFYHFHSLRWETFERHIAGPGGKLELMLRAREEGLVRHICCSVHDNAVALLRIANTGLFDVITLQYTNVLEIVFTCSFPAARASSRPTAVERRALAC